MTPNQRTIVPYWKDAIGLGSILHHPKEFVIFWGCNWCSYFDTSTNYGTYIRPEKFTTRKKRYSHLAGHVFWQVQITTGKNYDPKKKRYRHLADGWNKSQITVGHIIIKLEKITTRKKKVQSSGRRLEHKTQNTTHTNTSVSRCKFGRGKIPQNLHLLTLIAPMNST